MKSLIFRKLSSELNISTNSNYVDYEHIWNLGGCSSASLSRSEFYACERGNVVYGDDPATGSFAYSLLYPSDFGYATDQSGCDGSMNDWSNPGSGSETCKDASHNWLHRKDSRWTMTSGLTNIYDVFLVNAAVKMSYVRLYVRLEPTLYLKNTVKIKGGTGTSADPYILGM